jgi:hypothetical protein
MAELSFNFSLTGAGTINFSLKFDPNSNPCENLTGSEPTPTTISDLNIVRADSIPSDLPTEANEKPDFPGELSGVDGNVEASLYDNISEFDENDLNSLFGVDWPDFNTPSNSNTNRSLDNALVDAGMGEVLYAREVGIQSDTKPAPL